MIQKVFIWTSPLPLLMLLGVWVYMKQQDGWGQFAASYLFVVPVLLSPLMGILGLVLIAVEKKKKQPVANLWFSTLMAGSVVIFIVCAIIIDEFF